MQRMKRVLCILAIVLFTAGSMVVPIASAQSGHPQTKCPVLGNPINKKVYTDYQGKRIYFCCAGCPQQFAKDPQKYMKQMKDEGVVLEPAPTK